MDASIIWANPGLTLLGVLFCIFLILLVPIISALRRSREERHDVPLRKREPSVFDDYDLGERDYAGRNYQERSYDRNDYDYDDRDYEDRQEYASYFARNARNVSSDRRNASDRDSYELAGRSGARAQQRKPVRAAGPVRSVWFIIGACVGAGGLAAWWNLPTVNPASSVLALFDGSDPPPPTAEEPAAPVAIKEQDRVGEPDSESAAPVAIGDGEGTAEGEGVGQMIESFVTKLKARLPLDVGPGIRMVNVDSQGSAVALGFTIAQKVAADDAPKLQNELESRFRSSVCAAPPDPTNIHGLNEQGVLFIITYVDLSGNKVAGLTVEPNFCSSPA